MHIIYIFCLNLNLPENVGPLLLEDRLGVIVDELLRVEDGEQVVLGVHWDGGFLPGVIGLRSLTHNQLLNIEKLK